MRGKTILTYLTMAIFYVGCGDSYETKINEYWENRKDFFKKHDESPFIATGSTFDTLNYYSPNKKFRVNASYEVIKPVERIAIPTSTGDYRTYTKYARAKFELGGEQQTLLLLKREEGGEQLFLPFYDQTSARETYGGGRYLDLEEPFGNRIIIDFNYAYYPYCAYDIDYSCPLPPSINRISVAVKAGEKDVNQQ